MFSSNQYDFLSNESQNFSLPPVSPFYFSKPMTSPFTPAENVLESKYDWDDIADAPSIGNLPGLALSSDYSEIDSHSEFSTEIDSARSSPDSLSFTTESLFDVITEPTQEMKRFKHLCSRRAIEEKLTEIRADIIFRSQLENVSRPLALRLFQSAIISQHESNVVFLLNLLAFKKTLTAAMNELILNKKSLQDYCFCVLKNHSTQGIQFILEFAGVKDLLQQLNSTDKRELMTIIHRKNQSITSTSAVEKVLEKSDHKRLRLFDKKDKAKKQKMEKTQESNSVFKQSQ